MIRPTGHENHQFLPKCCKYVGHTCNGLNIPQKYSRYAAKNKENNFVNTAKLGLDFKSADGEVRQAVKWQTLEL